VSNGVAVGTTATPTTCGRPTVTTTAPVTTTTTTTGSAVPAQ